MAVLFQKYDEAHIFVVPMICHFGMAYKDDSFVYHYYVKKYIACRSKVFRSI